MRRGRRFLLLLAVLIAGAFGGRAYILHVYAPGLKAEARTIPARVHAELRAQGAPYTPLNGVAYDMQHAIVAIEDHRFYSHPGIDPLGVLRALWINARDKRLDQGGSTLEEQLAKRAIVGRDSTARDKLRTAALAWAIDLQFPKWKVLELYLNAAYFGRGAYGIGAAAHVYFATSAARLTLPQAAFLAAMPQAPSVYGAHPTSSTVRARWLQVLYDMAKDGLITSRQLAAARSSPPAFAFSVTG